MADHLETQATPSSSDSVSTVDFSSDNESLNTTTSTIGNSVFSRLRRARSIRDQAEEVAALTAAGLMHGGWDSVFLYLSGKMWVHTGIVKTGDIVKYR